LGAAGTSLQITIQQNMFANVLQLGEAISNAMSATGLNVTPKIKEAAQWREDLFAVQQGQPRSDMLMTSASNPIFDSIRVMGSYYPCGGQFSQWCDQDFTSKLNTAATLSGDQRAAAFQDLWAYAYNHYAFIPLFGLDFIHGVSPKLSWTPRDDGFVYFSDMELAS
jgi:peptide/nickel transport system substrate-binding protein